MSESNRAVAIESGFADATKIYVPANGSINGIDAERRFNPRLERQNARWEFRNGMDLDERAFVVVFVGRIAVDKGMAELAEAWEIVRRERPEARLVIGRAVRDDRDPLPPEVEKRLFSQPSVMPIVGRRHASVVRCRGYPGFAFLSGGVFGRPAGSFGHEIAE